jgi:hypothetical protein
MVEAYQANEMQGTLFVSIIIRPDLHNSGWPMEAHLVFFNILFEMWNIRKIYFEGFEFQVGPNARAPFATLEGRLTDHQYFAGRYRDWLIFSISREDWEATGSAAVLPQADG